MILDVTNYAIATNDRVTGLRGDGGSLLLDILTVVESYLLPKTPIHNSLNSSYLEYPVINWIMKSLNI